LFTLAETAPGVSSEFFSRESELLLQEDIFVLSWGLGGDCRTYVLSIILNLPTLERKSPACAYGLLWIVILVSLRRIALVVVAVGLWWTGWERKKASGGQLM
jgi:hypothetical protein